MRFTISFLLVLSVGGCGGSNKGGDGGATGGGSGTTGGTDMSAGTGTGGNGTPDGGATASTDMAMSCDVAAQTGCPTGQKCIPSGFKGGTCVANGTITEGQPCTTDMTTQNDNCQGGLICDNTGGGASLCRKICTADSTCTTAGQLCERYTSKFGACVPSCAPFGTDCAAGSDCGTAVDDISTSKTAATGFFVCKVTGTGAILSTCTADSDCAAGLECDPGTDPNSYWCQPNCDATHACPAAPTTDAGTGTIACQVFTNLPNSEGYCAGQ
jgi:hypothetical protein